MNRTLRFAKIVPEGKALGYVDGRACFVSGPLPGETAVVEITKQKSSYAEGTLERIVEPSPHRGTPADEHFMACSPWQGVDYPYQLELKRAMLQETFSRPDLALPVLGMVAAPQTLGYRNKLEFSLLGPEEGYGLAFHGRGTATGLVALPDGCALGTAAMNGLAQSISSRLLPAAMGDAPLSLVVRQSSAGAMLAVLNLRRPVKYDWNELMVPGLTGLTVQVRGRDGSFRLAWQKGAASLDEVLGGVTVSYPYGAFFQTNTAVFGLALEQILASLPAEARVVDLYGGCGAIGLPAARRVREVVGVEIDHAAAAQAEETAAREGLANYRSVAVAAERLDSEVLQGADVVIVDPPRAGLHPRVVEQLLQAAPKRIVYLSCNPVTQARDMRYLGDHYRSDGINGFDFYPGTLHLESLAIMDYQV